MIPDYKKGKDSAIRILKLNNRRSKINPEDNSGTVLVSHRLLSSDEHALRILCLFLGSNNGTRRIQRSEIRLPITAHPTRSKRL